MPASRAQARADRFLASAIGIEKDAGTCREQPGDRVQIEQMLTIACALELGERPQHTMIACAHCARLGYGDQGVDLTACVDGLLWCNDCSY